jgi:hypothetical protein
MDPINTEPSSCFGSFRKVESRIVFTYQRVDGGIFRFDHRGGKKILTHSNPFDSFEVEWYGNRVTFRWEDDHWVEETPHGEHNHFNRIIEQPANPQELVDNGKRTANDGDWATAREIYRTLADLSAVMYIGLDANTYQNYFGGNNKRKEIEKCLNENISELYFAMYDAAAHNVKYDGNLRQRPFVPCISNSNSNSTSTTDSNSDLPLLRVATFNILCPSYSDDALRNAGEPTPQHLERTRAPGLPACKDFLAWNYRSDLICKELEKCDAHVLVLQEMPKKKPERDDVETFLQEKGYKYKYFQRFRERDVANDPPYRFVRDDCVYIAWKSDRFEQVDYRQYEHYIREGEQSMKGVTGVVALKPRDEARDVGLIFAGGHMYWAKEAETFALLEKELKIWCANFPNFVPIVAMDFNCKVTKLLSLTPEWTSACQVTEFPGDEREMAAYLEPNVIERREVEPAEAADGSARCLLKTVGMQGSLIDLQSAERTRGGCPIQPDEVLFLKETMASGALKPKQFLQFAGRAGAGEFYIYSKNSKK